ncbi:hypothetical protein Celaphus_00008104 [Cervus elaphus hippelaphus]|uniref:Sodium/potassium-transporting ATPase subunit beta-3 n=1 Tax=Cervus elaphus hippelaphus TaxID=46360 RepID=A0A212CN69_CEREH|nr:hypothetical protein Celaphus_00008104 [Cervus elaphus hippelaphus]
MRFQKIMTRFQVQDLNGFSKTSDGIGFSFSMSNPESYKRYTDDLKKLLKPYGLEEQNLTECNNGNFSEPKGPDYTACQFPFALLEACRGVDDAKFGHNTGNLCTLVKMNRMIILKPQGEPRIECIAKNESPAVLSTYLPSGKIDIKYFSCYRKKLHGSDLRPLDEEIMCDLH